MEIRANEARETRAEGKTHNDDVSWHTVIKVRGRNYRFQRSNCYLQKCSRSRGLEAS